MRVVSQTVERCGMCGDGRRDLGADHPCGSVAAIESRILLNRAETKVFAVLLWLRSQWFEEVVWRWLRALCRLFGRHGRACEGRTDHRPVGHQL